MIPTAGSTGLFPFPQTIGSGMMKLRMICLMISALIALTADAGQRVRFDHLTINDGLPENSVRSILQDRHGFLWFGTQNGLARYDGYRMRTFLPEPGNPSSIGVRFVITMVEDNRGRLWLGSYSTGLAIYDPESETFTNHFTAADTPDSLPGSGIVDLEAVDKEVWISTGHGKLFRSDGVDFTPVPVPPLDQLQTVSGTKPLTGLKVTPRHVWVGSSGHGLAVQNRATGVWTHLTHDPNDPESLPSNYVTDVFLDRGGRIWVAGRGGLALHKGEGRFTVFQPRTDLGEGADNYLVCIAEDDAGDFWIGSAVGLFHFDPARARFTLYAHDPDEPASPVRGPVLSILIDDTGIIWAGSWHTGLNKFDPKSQKFDVFLHDPQNPGSLDDDAIGAVFEDSRGALWVGTGSRSPGGTRGGLNRRDPGATVFQHLAFPAEPDGAVFTVRRILEDEAKRIWLGTNRGVWQVTEDRDHIERPAELAGAPNSVIEGSINDLALDPAGRLWVAAWNGGLSRYDTVTGAWQEYLADASDPGSLSNVDLTAIEVDDRGRIWIGTDSGDVNLYDPNRDNFRRVILGDIAIEAVLAIMPGPDGRVWLSTTSGLLLCDPEGIAESHTIHDGLPSDFVGAMQTDLRGDLWVSTAMGLVRIVRENGQATVFDRRDGLPRNELHFAAARTRTGRLYFGGHYGLVSFHPDSLLLNEHAPPVRLTEVHIRDRHLEVGGDSPLRTALQSAEEIQLDHTQNDLSLTFAALDYAHPERNQYRYRLDPYDTDWRATGNRNTAHYTNLDPGAYEFSVMGSNGDGVWNQTPTLLRIVINPPWWRTGLAHTIYFMAAVLLVAAFVRWVVMRTRRRTARQIERAESRHLQELDQLKSRFFANISHEFRTPLTLLTAPLQRLQENPAEGTAELFHTMGRNARRLGRLIDQLLDLSRLEAERMPARWAHGDWAAYLRMLISPFDAMAEQRKMVLLTSWPAEPVTAWYEPDLLDKIVVNLLSNAVKFTPSGGEINVTVTQHSDTANRLWPGSADGGKPSSVEARMITIAVRNTGTYIPDSERDLVFDRFHQVARGTERIDIGSGIGLALVKELVEWFGGEAEVTSDRTTGTEFTVTMPFFVGEPPSDIARRGPTDPAAATEFDPSEELTVAGDEDPGLAAEDTDLPTILVVEDNQDLRTYIRTELTGEFNIMVAADGKAGLNLALSEIPDLVLSDVMMPEMDGLTLCERLKTDERTNHVPVILLTARVEAENRKEGLQTGADDYVAKPFDVEELRIRIRNLIEQRRLLAERFSQLVLARPGRTANPVPSADDAFLERVREIIIEHMEDPEFRVDALCREMAMSRTQLHRKFKAVAGRSAGEFIRIERLNKAAELLGQGDASVTEVAYDVGYKSLSQFAKAFREQFGMAPSDFEA